MIFLCKKLLSAKLSQLIPTWYIMQLVHRWQIFLISFVITEIFKFRIIFFTFFYLEKQNKNSDFSQWIIVSSSNLFVYKLLKNFLGKDPWPWYLSITGFDLLCYGHWLSILLQTVTNEYVVSALGYKRKVACDELAIDPISITLTFFSTNHVRTILSGVLIHFVGLLSTWHLHVHCIL